jgi:hypothetical protein
MDKYYFKTSKVSAEGVYASGKMIIQKGSIANKDLLSSFPNTLVEIRNDLIEKGVLITKGDKLLFTENFICSSPSQASALINGSSSNGLLAWKDRSGKTLKSNLREID